MKNPIKSQKKNQHLFMVKPWIFHDSRGSGWWLQPLWKIWKSIGMMTFPIYGKIKKVPVTTNQWDMSYMGYNNHMAGLWHCFTHKIPNSQCDSRWNSHFSWAPRPVAPSPPARVHAAWWLLMVILMALIHSFNLVQLCLTNGSLLKNTIKSSSDSENSSSHRSSLTNQ